MYAVVYGEFMEFGKVIDSIECYVCTENNAVVSYRVILYLDILIRHIELVQFDGYCDALFCFSAMPHTGAVTECVLVLLVINDNGYSITNISHQRLLTIWTEVTISLMHIVQ
jgi:hypothetical protein